MGRRKKWAWDKIDWDERIRTRKTKPRYIDDMNATELVEILNLRGVRAHRGIPIDELRELLRLSLKGVDKEISHPVDKYRDRLNWFVETYKEQIRDQLSEEDLKSFYERTDAEVLVTYFAPETKALIEREYEKWTSEKR